MGLDRYGRARVLTMEYGSRDSEMKQLDEMM